MAKPTLHFEELRKIAETASGNRYTSTWFRFTENDGVLHLQVSDAPLTEDQDSTVISYSGWTEPVFPAVTTALIGSGQTIIDLNLVPVPANPLVTDSQFTGTAAADAVFWSASAVEKFLVPYYASVFGDQAPSIVTRLVGIFVPPGSPELSPGTGVTQDDDPFYAVVHLPSSEYLGMSITGNNVSGGNRIPELYGLRRSGKVEAL
jgi:hypothetical protein